MLIDERQLEPIRVVFSFLWDRENTTKNTYIPLHCLQWRRYTLPISTIHSISQLFGRLFLFFFKTLSFYRFHGVWNNSATLKKTCENCKWCAYNARLHIYLFISIFFYWYACASAYSCCGDSRHTGLMIPDFVFPFAFLSVLMCSLDW